MARSCFRGPRRQAEAIRELSSPQLKSRFSSVDLRKKRPRDSGNLSENNMNAKLSIVLVACVALFVSACAPSPQSLILGKWEVESAPMKMTAEFSRDGTAKITMLGQTLQGTYKLDQNELVWTMNGTTTKGKVNVTPTELELTDDANRTIKYRRK
jgi:hypothetical protein